MSALSWGSIYTHTYFYVCVCIYIYIQIQQYINIHKYVYRCTNINTNLTMEKIEYPFRFNRYICQSYDEKDNRAPDY